MGQRKHRRIRAYSQMNEDKLIRVYRELLTEGDAYWRCMDHGSGDINRDISECEWWAEVRMIDLQTTVMA